MNTIFFEKGKFGVFGGEPEKSNYFQLITEL